MFEKEIILKEQLAARCLVQCSPARKLPAWRNCIRSGLQEDLSARLGHRRASPSILSNVSDILPHSRAAIQRFQILCRWWARLLLGQSVWLQDVVQRLLQFLDGTARILPQL
jgi:hypothetical protein